MRTVIAAFAAAATVLAVQAHSLQSKAIEALRATSRVGVLGQGDEAAASTFPATGLAVGIVGLDAQRQSLQDLLQTLSTQSCGDVACSAIHWPGVNGHALPLDEMVESGMLTSGAYASAVAPASAIGGEYMTAGAVGCALSHMQMWERAVAENRPVVAMEDDVTLAPNFGAAVGALLKEIPEDFGLVHLGHGLETAPAEAIVREGTASVELTQYGWGTYGYIVSPAMAAVFLEQALPLSQQVDGFMRNTALAAGFKTYMAKQRLVRTNAEVGRTSSVQVYALPDYQMPTTLAVVGRKAAASAAVCDALVEQGLPEPWVCSAVAVPAVVEHAGHQQMDKYLDVLRHMGGGLMMSAKANSMPALAAFRGKSLVLGVTPAGEAALRQACHTFDEPALVSAIDNGLVVLGATVDALDTVNSASLALAMCSADMRAHLGMSRILLRETLVAHNTVAAAIARIAPASNVIKPVLSGAAVELPAGMPASLHLCWLNGVTAPEHVHARVAQWRDMQAGWSVRLWTAEDFDASHPVEGMILELAKVSAAEAADVARWYILERHGGVFVDADVQPLRRLDATLAAAGAASQSARGVLVLANSVDEHAGLPEAFLSTGLVAVTRHHPAAARMVAALVRQVAVTAPWAAQAARHMSIVTGPSFVRRALGSDVTQAVMLPAAAVYPVSWADSESLKTTCQGGVCESSSFPGSLAVHMWGLELSAKAEAPAAPAPATVEEPAAPVPAPAKVLPASATMDEPAAPAAPAVVEKPAAPALAPTKVLPAARPSPAPGMVPMTGDVLGLASGRRLDAFASATATPTTSPSASPVASTSVAPAASQSPAPTGTSTPIPAVTPSSTPAAPTPDATPLSSPPAQAKSASVKVKLGLNGMSQCAAATETVQKAVRRGIYNSLPSAMRLVVPFNRVLTCVVGAEKCASPAAQAFACSTSARRLGVSARYLQSTDATVESTIVLYTEGDDATQAQQAMSTALQSSGETVNSGASFATVLKQLVATVSTKMEEAATAPAAGGASPLQQQLQQAAVDEGATDLQNVQVSAEVSSQVGQDVDEPVPASSTESNTFMFAAVGIVAVLVLGVVWITARSRKTSNPANHSDGDAHGVEFSNIADAQAAAEAQEEGNRV